MGCPPPLDPEVAPRVMGLQAVSWGVWGPVYHYRVHNRMVFNNTQFKTIIVFVCAPVWHAACGYLGSKGIYGRKVMRTPPKEIHLSIVHSLRSS